MAEITTADAPVGDDLDVHRQFCFALYSTALALGRTYAPILAELGLTYPQYLVMLVLWTEDDRSVKSIGEHLGLDSGTLTPVLKRLTTAGLVERTRDAGDERMVRTRLTASGRDLRSRAVDIPCRVTAAMGMPPRDLMRLQGELETIRDALGGHG